MTLTDTELLALARVGAEARLSSIFAEEARIRAAFSLPQPQEAPQPPATHTMSAAQRQAVSRRMKAYWRARRAAKQKSR